MNLFANNYLNESWEEDYRDLFPKIVPYYTFSEYCELTGNPKDLTPIEYVYQYEFTKDSFDPEVDSLDEAVEENDIDIVEEINILSENNEFKALVEMGWKPGLLATEESMNEAFERQINWFSENHRSIEIDSTNYDSPIYLKEITDKEVEKNENLAPIFVVQQFEPSPAGLVIKGYSKLTGKKWKYSHAGLALNSSLSHVYTFLLKGMSVESITKFAARGNDIRVQALFITPKARNMIKKQLDFYLANQDKTKYSFAGLIKLVFNMGKQKKFSTQMFCSEFVDAILKGAKIDASGKASENVAPEDIGLYTDNINIYKVFEGKAADYDQTKVDEQIEKLKHTEHYARLNAVKTKAERTELKAKREEEKAEKEEEFNNSIKGKAVNAVKKAGKAVAGVPKKGIKAAMDKYSEYQTSTAYKEPTAAEARTHLATESAEE